MEIKDLCYTTPLLQIKQWVSPYVNVVQLNEICLSVQTDVPLTLKVIQSHNQLDQGPEYNYKIYSGWSTRSFRRTLSYVKLVLINETDLENKLLTLFALSDKKIKEIPEIPREIEIPHTEIKTEQRSKSPFCSILKKKKTNERELPCCKGPHLPELLSRNSLLCGDWNKQIKCIPPPCLGQSAPQVLVFQNESFEWVCVNLEKVDTKNVNWKFD